MGKAKWVLQAVIFSSLRRQFRRYPQYNEVLKQAKREVMVTGKTKDNIRRVKYQCACCGKLFSKDEVEVDHLESVIPLEGLPKIGDLPDFNIYIARLFCGVSGLQVLDKTCHKAKSKLENTKRREIKNERNPKPVRKTTTRRRKSTTH